MLKGEVIKISFIRLRIQMKLLVLPIIAEY